MTLAIASVAFVAVYICLAVYILWLRNVSCSKRMSISELRINVLISVNFSIVEIPRQFQVHIFSLLELVIVGP